MSGESEPAIEINPHSDLPAVPDISPEISEPAKVSEDITDPERPLPFGVYRAPVVAAS
tara:strand:- start:2924 stop:3097 length:174 start_codon:yes stop_codon:yes gene_type:complete